MAEGEEVLVHLALPRRDLAEVVDALLCKLRRKHAVNLKIVGLLEKAARRGGTPVSLQLSEAAAEEGSAAVEARTRLRAATTPEESGAPALSAPSSGGGEIQKAEAELKDGEDEEGRRMYRAVRRPAAGQAASSLAIVGCGEVAHLYAACLGHKPGFGVVACVDKDPASAQRLARRVDAQQQRQYGPAWPRCAALPSLEALFRDVPAERCRVVVNLTPAPLHGAVTRQCLLAGRHVWTEKPLAEGHAEADVLVQLASELGLELGCAPMTLLGASQRLVQRLVLAARPPPPTDADAAGDDAHPVGVVLHAHADVYCGCWEPHAFRAEAGGWQAHRRLSLGSWRDVGVYPLALFTALLGPVQRVSAVSAPLPADLWQVRLCFGDGRFATLACSLSVSKPKELAYAARLEGDRGTLYTGPLWDFDTPLTLVPDGGARGQGKRTRLLPQAPAPRVLHGLAHPHQCDWARGVELLAERVDRRRSGGGDHGQEAGVGFSAAQGAHLVEVLAAAEASAAAGGQDTPVASAFPWPLPHPVVGAVEHVSLPLRPRGDATTRAARLVVGCAGLGGVPDALGFLDAAWSLGCNTFDLAFVYGRKSEGLVGRWLSERRRAAHLRNGGVSRQDVLLIGKGGHPTSSAPGAKRARLDVAELEADLEQSLQRLGTDYFDLFLLHRDDPRAYPDVGPIVEAMSRLVVAGRIRGWGVSNWALARLRAACEFAASREGCVPPVLSSPQLSLAVPTRPPWPDTVSLTSEARAFCDVLREGSCVHILGWSPLAQGYLARGGDAAGGPQDPASGGCWDGPDNARRRRRLARLAHAKGASMGQLAVAYALAAGADLVALGTRSIEHLHDAVAVFDKPTLTPNELAFLRDP